MKLGEGFGPLEFDFRAVGLRFTEVEVLAVDVHHVAEGRGAPAEELEVGLVVLEEVFVDGPLGSLEGQAGFAGELLAHVAIGDVHERADLAAA